MPTRHDIQHAAANDPPAKGRAWTAIVLENCLLQLTFERVISGKRYDFDDNIKCGRPYSLLRDFAVARCAARYRLSKEAGFRFNEFVTLKQAQ